MDKDIFNWKQHFSGKDSFNLQKFWMNDSASNMKATETKLTKNRILSGEMYSLSVSMLSFYKHKYRRCCSKLLYICCFRYTNCQYHSVFNNNTDKPNKPSIMHTMAKVTHH